MLLDFINPLVRDVDGIDEDPTDEARCVLSSRAICHSAIGGLCLM